MKAWRGMGGKAWLAVLGTAAAGLAVVAAAHATEVLLKDGRILKGKLGEATSLCETPKSSDPESRLKTIVFIDNELTRTYVSKRQVQEVRPDTAAGAGEKFSIRQRIRGGKVVKGVGPALKIEPWDEYGRRTFVMQTAQGPLNVIQAITEITPQWTKVEAINYTWEMRIATSSIPRDVLDKVLMRQINKENVEDRKKIASFYLQSERYKEARETLEQILVDFAAHPQFTAIKQQLEPTIRTLRQMGAQAALKELRLRRTGGQHQLVQAMLEKFPSDDVAGEILQVVREMTQEYEGLEASRAKAIKEFKALVPKVADKPTRLAMESVGKELAAELSVDTLARMAGFLQNLDDPQLPPAEKLSLAASGWLLGADSAVTQPTVAVAAYKVRELVRQYLRDGIKLNRQRTLGQFPYDESSAPVRVARLLAHMKPPLDLPEPVDENSPGYYKLEVMGMPKETMVTYYVQLPPEYNPYRRYPLVVTLHGAGSTAEQQIDWWAGARSPRGRAGQATRQGYIVLAPEWMDPHQKEYEFSAREHAAVLNCLRDACRRFAIDTDRVYLSGHSMGGDAAWDLALAHPDLWAGVVPIVAESQKFCTLYWENAQYVPFYLVGGELDGAKLARNARDLDRYFLRGYNATVVEYQGRGHEHFSDETQRIFDWMGRFRREFFRREFTCASMRQFDNFFWWVEVEGLPRNSYAVQWPPPRGTRPIEIKATVLPNNNLNVRTGTSKVIVWLSPDMVDFKGRANIVINGRRINDPDQFKPSRDVLLEDVRTRGDRQHPFWAKIETTTGRGGE